MTVSFYTMGCNVNLAETERQFSEILKEFDQGEGNISAVHNNELHERTGYLLNSSRDRQRSIKDIMANSKQPAHDPVVGQDELLELFAANG